MDDRPPVIPGETPRPRRRRDDPVELLGDWSWEEAGAGAPRGTAELTHRFHDPAAEHDGEPDLGPVRPTIPPPAPPATPEHPDGRRRVPAGHAVLVALIALVVGTLLNADGMRKTAEGQPLGATRDVAVALTSALTAVTGFLQVDEPRKLVKAALGRSDDDRFSTKVTVATAPTHRRSGAEPLYGPRHHLHLYVTGDSLMIDPGPALLERAAASGVIDAVAPADAHAATGLVRPEVFNWFEYLPKQLDKLEPDLTVVAFGGNDGQGIPGVPGAEDVGSPAWTAEYHRRVAGVMNAFTSRGVKLMWVGLPIPRDPDLARRFRIMNAVYRSEAASRRGEVYFLDIYSRFADKHGHYADYLPDASGNLVKMRQADGIHLDTPGAQIVAQKVIDSLGKLVRLRGR